MLKALLRTFTKFVNVKEQTPEMVLGPNTAESLQEYSRAMAFMQGQKWEMAEGELVKTLEILGKSEHFAEPSYNLVLQRIALVQRAQGKDGKCEQTLEEVVKNYRRDERYRSQLELAYQTLYKQYLASNLPKALKLGEILQREQHWKKLKKETQKNIKFLYGTALVLEGKEYSKAKKIFNDCIKLNPEGNSCFVFHNLGVAQWLHAKSWSNSTPQTLSGSKEEEFKKATFEFTESIPNLQKAVQLFEGFPEIYTLESEFGFKNKLTGLSLVNIGEIFLEKLEPDVIPTQNAHKWLNIAIKFYEDLDKSELGRTLGLIATLMKAKGDLKHAESLLKSANDLLSTVNPIQKPSFTQILILENLLSITKIRGGSEADAEKLHKKAQELAAKLPYWYERMPYLHVPQWTL